MTEEKKVFNKGDKVTEEYEYVCVPCGFKRHYKAGDEFSECTSCLAGTEEGNPEYVEGTGMWEKIKKT